MPSKQLSWQPSSGTFEVQYRKKGSTSWINYSGNPVSSPPIIIPNLLENTTYEWQVRADCGDGLFTPWIKGVDFYIPYACRVPINLTATLASNTITVKWSDTASGPIALTPDPEVKIYAKKNDTTTKVELTDTPLPHYSDGQKVFTNVSADLTPGTYTIIFETQCPDGSKPTKTATTPAIVIPPPACNPVAPANITFVPQNAPDNSYFQWPAVSGVLTYDVEIYEKQGTAYSIIASFNTNDPNTQDWSPQSTSIDPTDLVVTAGAMGCVYPDPQYANPANNQNYTVEYKPGGVSTPIPKGIKVGIRFTGLPPNQVGWLIYETLPVTAPGDVPLLYFCVPNYNQFFPPDWFPSEGYASSPPNGFVVGTTYKIRVRSKCQYNTSTWAEKEVYFQLPNCPIVVDPSPVPPLDFSATRNGTTVTVSFHIQRPNVNPYPNQSTWIAQIIAHYVTGAACIPSVDREVYTNDTSIPGYPVQGKITFKANGDIVFDYMWLYPSQGTYFFTGQYQI